MINSKLNFAAISFLIYKNKESDKKSSFIYMRILDLLIFMVGKYSIRSCSRNEKSKHKYNHFINNLVDY